MHGYVNTHLSGMKNMMCLMNIMNVLGWYHDAIDECYLWINEILLSCLSLLLNMFSALGYTKHGMLARWMVGYTMFRWMLGGIRMLKQFWFWRIAQHPQSLITSVEPICALCWEQRYEWMKQRPVAVMQCNSLDFQDFKKRPPIVRGFFSWHKVTL